MSSNPLGNSFQPPIPQWPAAYMTPSGGAYGQHLFDDVTAFYSWYVTSWCLASGEPSSVSSHKNDSVRKILSLIKRIAEVSMNGGYFLTERQEIKAVHHLSEIVQDLNGGGLRQQDLPEALFKLMIDLTENNPKAKVVAQTTELEYRLCINPSPEQTSVQTEQYQLVLSQIIQKINPKMHDTNALAISQGLSQILENTKAVTDTSHAINEAIKHWL